MKKLMIAAFAALGFTGSAMAAPLGNTGINIGMALDSYWDVDAESFQSTLTPTLGYDWLGFNLSATTDLAIVKNDTIVAMDMFDTLPVVDLGASYTLGSGLAATAYGAMEFDLDATEFSGAKVGVKIEF
jgi:hypothetical protein